VLIFVEAGLRVKGAFPLFSEKYLIEPTLLKKVNREFCMCNIGQNFEGPPLLFSTTLATALKRFINI
jgi:hypothetical protein